MNLKTLSISVLILAILSGIVAWLNRPVTATATDPRVGSSLLADVSANDVDTIALSSNGNTVELQRDNATAAWRVASYHNLPADESKLRRLVQELAEATIDRVVTRNPERAARLQLGEATVALTANGSTTTLNFGKTAERGGRYLQYDDRSDAPVYLTPASTYLDTTAKNWASSALTAFEAADIKRIEVGFVDEPSLTVSRASADAAWTAENLSETQRLREQPITSMLNQLSTLRFTDTASPDHTDVIAAQNHSRTLALTTFNDEIINITVGRKPEEVLPPEAPETEEATTETAETEAPLEDLTETIPAGPVYVAFDAPTPLAPLIDSQDQLAFEIAEYVFNNLPTDRAVLVEEIPAPPATE